MILLEPSVKLRVLKSKVIDTPIKFRQQTERVAVFLAKQNNFNIKEVEIRLLYNNNKKDKHVDVLINFS